jgi:hypothetical protein
MIGYEDLTWNGNELRYRGRTLATIEPDAAAAMYRGHRPGHLPDFWLFSFSFSKGILG